MNNGMNLEERKQFEELMYDKAEIHRLHKKRNFNLHSILAELYSRPSHFIYELLQNAEDAGAKKVQFVLTEEGLDTYHDGREFNYKDIDGITSVGNTEKADDLTKIGRFGIGFKSVFAITSTPHIFSGYYNIKIENLFVPVPIPSEPEMNYEKRGLRTLIRLPFDHKIMPREEAFQIVSEKLGNLEPRTLLFLKNINKVEWKILAAESSEGSCTRSSKNNITHSNSSLRVKRVRLTSQREVVRYLVLERPIKIQGEPLSVEVAFRLDKGKGDKEAIVPEKNSKLVVFFPTERETFLDFVVQGPYITTPSRENIPFNKEQNQKIIDETGKLVAASLPVIRDLGYLNTDFLSMLPIDSEQTDNIYSVLYDKVKDKLLSGKLLPDLQGGHTTPGKAVLADGRGLTEFLKKADLNELFSRTTWLNTNITGDRTPELREYLIDELGVYEVNFRSFASKITKEFLKRKSDKWMVDFYSRLLGQRALWNKDGSPHSLLNTKPIMRLDTGEHIAPFNAKRALQTYLPTTTKSSNYPMVKEVFIKNEKSYEFLKELGVKKPDIHAEIREFIIPKYQSNRQISVEECIGDFKKIFKSYTTIRSDEKAALLGQLIQTSFIFSVDSSEKNYRLVPKSCYMPSDELGEFFKGDESVRFVSSRLLEKNKDGAVAKFLRELGVESRPRHNEIHDLTYEERRELRNGGKFSREDYKDYIFEGLENFFQSEVTPEKSYLLWRLLIKSIEGMTYEKAKSFFINTYGWQHYGWHYTEFETRSLKILQQTKWLVDKNDDLRKPSDLTLFELSDDYEKSGWNASTLIEQLQFKPELPPEELKIMDLERENDELKREKENLKQENDELKKNLEKYEGKKSRKKWEPEVKSNEVSPPIPETKSYNSNNIELRVQAHEKVKEPAPVFNPAEQLDNFDETEEESQNESLVDKKAIGKWSEDVVYKALKEKYGQRGEVIWLNEKGPGGDHRMGYDMRVEENSSVTMYVEVKGTTQSDPKSIEVQGTQWALARKLYERGEGEKYYFYVVSGAGTNSVEIKTPIRNPYGGWKEGWLQAHPVHIKLPKNTQDD